nr:MAG TPA: hypothetical protein [Caudoviricetes sp.]
MHDMCMSNRLQYYSPHIFQSSEQRPVDKV